MAGEGRIETVVPLINIVRLDRLVLLIRHNAKLPTRWQQPIMDRVVIIFWTSMILFSCGTKENSNVELELYSMENDTIENVNSIQLTNKPELLTGRSIFFWDKWGLRTYEFKNIKKTDKNKFIIENIEPDEYTLFISLTVDGVEKLAELRDLEIVAGQNRFRKQITLNGIRSYLGE